MFYTYVLLCSDESKKTNKFYIGFTEDLKRRFEEHKLKRVETTKKFDCIKLAYYEACNNKTDARKRELQLKTGFGRGYLRKRIEKDLRD